MKNLFNQILSATVAVSLVFSVSIAKSAGATSIPLLRLKLSVDALNSDDIAIGFLSTATTQYNNNLDSRYFPGINSPEGLACYSSDNVPLSSYVLPLPAQGLQVIRLDIEAAATGQLTLERTELDSIPALYDIWLMDKYAKDSLNLRSGADYVFHVNKADSNSFGSNRFQVVIRQNPQYNLRLLNFDAIKETGDTEIIWTTENEQNTTLFAVERSIDGGKTFVSIDTLTSNGSGYYTYTDRSPIDGTDSYRLELTDANGNISYSAAISLTFGSEQAATTVTPNAISIYPNPSVGAINLSINTQSDNSTSAAASGQPQIAGVRSLSPVNSPAAATSYAIKIFNMRGMIIRSATSSSSIWQDNVSSLTPGTYIVEVTDNASARMVGKSTFIKL
jgi:hypothetical protein